MLRAEIRSDGPGGIGLVHRWRDPQDFDFALLEEPAGIRVMGRREGGAGRLLAEGGRDATAGYPAGEWLRLRLLAEGGRVELAVNERVVLAGRDGALGVPGAVGLFCRGPDRARFRHFRLSSP